MKLHLIRHAKTEKIAPSGKDFDRELKDSGRTDTEQLAKYLKSLGFQPDRTLCSTAKRTLQTCEILNATFQFQALSFHDDLYLAEASVIKSLLETCKAEENLTVIGHNDGISDLASYLTGQFISLPTTGYVCIEFFIDEWNELSKDAGMIIDFYRPL
ncbi:MAG: histidine phosphatase family protein [Bacteroidota bacterium]